MRGVKQWWYTARYRRVLRRFYDRLLLEQLPREAWPQWGRRISLAQCQRRAGKRSQALAKRGYPFPPDCLALYTQIRAALKKHYA